jgi:hypothetical protein
MQSYRAENTLTWLQKHFKKIIAVCCDIHVKHINTLREKQVEVS